MAPLTDPTAPTLASFFRPKTADTRRFVARVRRAGLERFSDQDVAETSGLLASQNNGRRLLALATQVRLPSPIEDWVWDQVQRYVATRMPADLHLDGEPIEVLLKVRDAALKRAAAAMCGPQEAMSLTLLTSTWLIRKRNLDPLAAFMAVKSLFRGTIAQGESIVRTALTSGKASEIQRIVATYNLFKTGDAGLHSRASFDAPVRAAPHAHRSHHQASPDGSSSERSREFRADGPASAKHRCSVR